MDQISLNTTTSSWFNPSQKLKFPNGITLITGEAGSGYTEYANRFILQTIKRDASMMVVTNEWDDSRWRKIQTAAASVNKDDCCHLLPDSVLGQTLNQTKRLQSGHVLTINLDLNGLTPNEDNLKKSLERLEKACSILHFTIAQQKMKVPVLVYLLDVFQTIDFKSVNKLLRPLLISDCDISFIVVNNKSVFEENQDEFEWLLERISTEIEIQSSDRILLTQGFKTKVLTSFPEKD